MLASGRGSNLQVAYFDQMRAQLNEEASLADTIAPGSDWRDVKPDVLAILAPLRRIAARFVPALRPSAPSEPERAASGAPDTRELRLDELEAYASLRREEITAQLPRIADDIGLRAASASESGELAIVDLWLQAKRPSAHAA